MTIREKIENLVPNHESTDDVLIGLISDGISETTGRIVQLDPAKSEHFMVQHKVSSGEGSSIYGELISVVRENGTKGQFQPCTKIPPNDRYLATDTDSLKFRSKHNPGYYILQKSGGEWDGTENRFDYYPSVYVVPTPGTEGNSAYVNEILYTVSTALLISANTLDREIIVGATYQGDTVYTFPSRWTYVVMLYVAIKILESKMADGAINEEDEELVKLFADSKSSYQSQYDTFFSLLAPRKGGEGEG